MRRLRRLVGSERVGSPRRVDSHRPGLFELVPLPAELGDRDGQAGTVATGLLAAGAPAAGVPAAGAPVTGTPLRRFRSGARAMVRFEGERPVRIESRVVSGIVTEAVGPWRCQGEWWQRGREWDRVEWDVEVRGRGIFRLVEEGGEWKVEGRYG